MNIPYTSFITSCNEQQPIAIQLKKKKEKKKKDECCERFRKKGKSFCKSCPQKWA